MEMCWFSGWIGALLWYFQKSEDLGPREWLGQSSTVGERRKRVSAEVEIVTVWAGTGLILRSLLKSFYVSF